MHNHRTELVRVVSLSGEKLVSARSKRSSIDVLDRFGVYWHRVSKQFQDPPHYIGFYFHGKLQSIRHVEQYERASRPSESRLLAASKDDSPRFATPHFIFKLGPPISPRHKLPVGTIRYGHEMQCHLIHLFTANTIEEAWKRTTADGHRARRGPGSDMGKTTTAA